MAGRLNKRARRRAKAEKELPVLVEAPAEVVTDDEIRALLQEPMQASGDEPVYDLYDWILGWCQDVRAPPLCRRWALRKRRESEDRMVPLPVVRAINLWWQQAGE